MQHPLDAEIREQVARYTRHEVSLGQLADWLTPRILYLDEHSDDLPELAEMAARIDLRLIEYGEGCWDEEQLRKLLAPYALPSTRGPEGATSVASH